MGIITAKALVDQAILVALTRTLTTSSIHPTRINHKNPRKTMNKLLTSSEEMDISLRLEFLQASSNSHKKIRDMNRKASRRSTVKIELRSRSIALMNSSSAGSAGESSIQTASKSTKVSAERFSKKREKSSILKSSD